MDAMADALSLVQLDDSRWYDNMDFVQLQSKDVIDDLTKGDDDSSNSISEMAQKSKEDAPEEKKEEKKSDEKSEDKAEEKPEEKKKEEKKPEDKKEEKK